MASLKTSQVDSVQPGETVKILNSWTISHTESRSERTECHWKGTCYEDN